MKPRTRKLASALRDSLLAAADPSRAPAMQAYMKSALPYFGVTAPRAKAVFREVFAAYPFDDAGRWREDVLGLWHGATHREEWYGALALAGDRRGAPFRTLGTLGLFEELIVTGAWWDVVDEIATHRVRELLVAHPVEMKKAMRAWSRSDDMWKRRTSIICQVGAKGATDRELLYACIAPSIGSKELFLRKAIGWALRDLAWYEPAEVVRWVRAHDAELSGLSKREALKNVPRLEAGEAAVRKVPARDDAEDAEAGPGPEALRHGGRRRRAGSSGASS